MSPEIVTVPIKKEAYAQGHQYCLDANGNEVPFMWQRTSPKTGKTCHLRIFAGRKSLLEWREGQEWPGEDAIEAAKKQARAIIQEDM